MTSFDKPQLQALLVADHVYRDQGSCKYIVSGIFHTLFVRDSDMDDDPEESPSDECVEAQKTLKGGVQAGSPFCYFSLVNVRNFQEFTLRYVELKTDKVEFEARLKIDCKDPIAPAECRLQLPLLPMRLGSYVLELLWKNEPLGSYRINVKKLDVPARRGYE